MNDINSYDVRRVLCSGDLKGDLPRDTGGGRAILYPITYGFSFGT